MPWLTQLATIARRTGYPVVEVDGWRTRGHGEQPQVLGIVCHHTAGWNDRHVVVNGRPGLDGPLSHFWLAKDGTIHVVAAGRCWHNAPSTSPHHGNSTSLGIEAENDGKTPWPARQLDAYRRLCAELCKAFNLPASRVKGHKEVNTGKIDPHSINMNTFRAEVARLITGRSPIPREDSMPLADKDVKRIADAVYDRLTHKVPEGVWAEREGILAAGQKIDPRTAFRQTWAYGKDTHARVRRLEEAVERLTAAVTRLQAQAEGAVESK